MWDFSSPYHHKSMGAVERVNQTLWNKLRKISGFGEKRWYRCVDEAVTAVNISFNRSIGTSPYVFMKGENPVMECDRRNNLRSKRVNLDKLRKQREEIRKKYDLEIRKGDVGVSHNLLPGTKVLIFKEEGTNKLRARWLQGYSVVMKKDLDAYLITDGRKTFQLNKSMVKEDTTE